MSLIPTPAESNSGRAEWPFTMAAMVFAFTLILSPLVTIRAAGNPIVGCAASTFMLVLSFIWVIVLLTALRDQVCGGVVSWSVVSLGLNFVWFLLSVLSICVEATMSRAHMG